MRVLNGVAQQVNQDLSDLSLVGLDGGDETDILLYAKRWAEMPESGLKKYVLRT